MLYAATEHCAKQQVHCRSIAPYNKRQQLPRAHKGPAACGKRVCGRLSLLPQSNDTRARVSATAKLAQGVNERARWSLSVAMCCRLESPSLQLQEHQCLLMSNIGGAAMHEASENTAVIAGPRSKQVNRQKNALLKI